MAALAGRLHRPLHRRPAVRHRLRQRTPRQEGARLGLLLPRHDAGDLGPLQPGRLLPVQRPLAVGGLPRRQAQRQHPRLRHVPQHLPARLHPPERPQPAHPELHHLVQAERPAQHHRAHPHREHGADHLGRERDAGARPEVDVQLLGGEGAGGRQADAQPLGVRRHAEGRTRQRPSPLAEAAGAARTPGAGGAKPDDLLLDPFGGAGTSAIAAQKCGRRWLLIESEAEYVEMARRRLRAVET